MLRHGFASLLLGALALVSCSERVTPPDGRFEADYEWAIGEGAMGTPMISRLSASGTYSHRCLVYPADAAAITYECAPGLPDGGGDANADAATVITVDDVLNAMNDADVLAGFARDTGGAPVLFGFDLRVVDGGVFRVTRSDGRELLVGDDCAAHSYDVCLEIPSGISRLVDLLSRLDAQQLAAPGCEKFQAGGMCYGAGVVDP